MEAGCSTTTSLGHQGDPLSSELVNAMITGANVVPYFVIEIIVNIVNNFSWFVFPSVFVNTTHTLTKSRSAIFFLLNQLDPNLHLDPLPGV